MSKIFNPVGWFEIPVIDMERAMKFYSSVFGHALAKHENLNMKGIEMTFFPMNQDATGATGALVKMTGDKCKWGPSSSGTLIYFSVADVAKAVENVKSNGGSITKDRSSIGEHGFIAIAKDTEGNSIGIHGMH